jgi:hypothetical protein
MLGQSFPANEKRSGKLEFVDGWTGVTFRRGGSSSSRKAEFDGRTTAEARGPWK